MSTGATCPPGSALHGGFSVTTPGSVKAATGFARFELALAPHQVWRQWPFELLRLASDSPWRRARSGASSYLNCL